MAGRGTFVMGLGAQKAGTTWLADHLQRSPAYDQGYRKEYHVFDSVDLPTEEWMRRRVARLAGKAVEAVAEGRGTKDDADQLHRLAMVADTSRYYDYFASLLDRDPAVVATGDLTPDYGMLPASRLAAVRDELAARDVRTVAVFLMRDPLERVWSHIRMKAHRNPRQFDVEPVEVLRRDHAQPSYALRTQYHLTLDAMRSTWGPEETYVGLYESLFTDASHVEDICRLVGIASPPARLGKARNASPKPVRALPDDVVRAVVTAYAETYRGVAERVPELDVERWWPHLRLLP